MPRALGLLLLAFLLAVLPPEAQAQTQDHIVHRRGKLWETVWNFMMSGHAGAWDYLALTPMGLYPGFAGYNHPSGSEFNAVDTYSNANMHNFRGGPWILARNLMIPGNPPNNTPTPADYEVTRTSNDLYGVMQVRPDIVLRQNYLESPDFDSRLPEEMSVATMHTNTGITVTQRTYVWGFPDYDDFIIYDYVFKNTGQIVSNVTGEVVPNTQQFQQTLRDVYFMFEGATSVSTKSQIAFYNDLVCVSAGAFGWQPPYHDYYHVSDGNTLVYATNVNGGAAPPPENCGFIKDNQAWKQRFGEELLSPAAFGWLALYASPRGATPRATPAPDVLRIDSHKGGTFQGRDLDHEYFRLSANASKKQHYEFAQTPSLQEGLGNNGNRFNFFFLSYGPYTLAPGDSVRITLAEIAGVMDYAEAVAGDPNGHFPDSTIAAIERNADAARRAIAWGHGAVVNGIPLAADVPEPPPAPETDAVNASVGTEKAAIAVTWDDVAETATINDSAGNVYYDGASDLDGYRIYRSRDFQYNPGEPGTPTFRGAYWTLLKEIPRAEMSQYFDPELGRYRFVDEDVNFGFRYGYYVAAYTNSPGPWTSANGTVVTHLPPMESGDYNRSAPTAAAAGPVTDFDIYAVPNPFVYGDPDRSFGLADPYRIEFRNLPERATIRIYTISGDLVRTIEHGPDERGNLYGSVAWDQKTDSGLLVAPGLYIYHVQSRTEGVSGPLTGKLMIIR